MYMNLHTLPTGTELWTVALTDQPTSVPPFDLLYDEVDVVTSAGASTTEIIAAADLRGYEGWRVIGIICQSSGFVLAEAYDGDLR